MAANPFSLMFGKEPDQLIDRALQSNEICNAFLSEKPPSQAYLITGVRGSGKTVMLTEIQKRLAANPDFVAVELNPDRDLLQQLAARLYDDRRFSSVFQKAQINLSLFGIGVEVKGVPPISDIEVALDRQLEQLGKTGTRLLITIDEVSNSGNMRAFASAFQILVRKNHPVFLLMTGLFENIDALQNEKTLTFLHRAPKVHMTPLNTGRMVNSYRTIFAIDDDDARKMAVLTRGYSFAFQTLGYFTFENNGNYQLALPPCRQYLEEYAYDKIWSSLSATDRRVCHAIACSAEGHTKEIMELLQISKNAFSPYRDRLLKRGIALSPGRGILTFALPFFEDYVKDRFSETDLL